MPWEGPNPGNGVGEWVWAGALAFLGRVLVLANRPIRPSGWALVVSLLWELPVAGALLVVGRAVAQSAGATGSIYDAIILTVAYGGTRTLSFFVARIYGPRHPSI